MNLSLCGQQAQGRTSGSVGVGVLQSADGVERTRVGYDFASRTLFVDRSRSSSLPAAVPGGGALPSTGKQGYGPSRQSPFVSRSARRALLTQRVNLGSLPYRYGRSSQD